MSFEGQNEIEFAKRFSTKEACFAHLFHYKWMDGFICPHCQCNEESHCYLEYFKRCKGCNNLISPTSNTLFHNVKFGIVKAFWAVFKMSATTKSISAEQLSKVIGVNRKTALLFQQKVRLAMQSSECYPLTGQVEVDEAFIGQEEEGAIGRGTHEKAQIVVAVEKYGATGVKRMYARKIENASTKELSSIFEKHISPTANVLTDKWKGYSPFSELYNITQEKSQPDINFKVMHRCIQQLKSWLRGIHHSVSHNFLQGYLDEFCYRINRSTHKNSIFENLISRMVNAVYIPKKFIKLQYGG
jgi:transposase-like protein